MAEINCGMSEGTWLSDAEFYSEVEKIFWMKRDGTPGKEIPEHLYERAEAYDYMFCNLMEYGFHWLSMKNNEKQEMVQLD